MRGIDCQAKEEKSPQNRAGRSERERPAGQIWRVFFVNAEYDWETFYRTVEE